MKIVPNNIIPFPGFLAINLFGVLFVRKARIDKVTDVTINHESIHTAQMKELLYIGFYIIYFFEWLFNLIFHTKDAYDRISFEREAYQYEKDLDYLKTRKHYAQWNKTITK